MINAEQFIEQALALGYRRYAGVPCSFLTSFINYVIDDPELSYVAASNEGDAVAVAAGNWLGGQPGVAMMQNSGLGNAVSPLTSLNQTCRIPVLLIITLRGDPELEDEPQHELMGRITPGLLETMEIPWAWFPADAADIEPALAEAHAYMQEQQRPYAFIMRKGSIAPTRPEPRNAPPVVPRSEMVVERIETPPPFPGRADVLAHLVELTPEDHSVVFATTGYTGRELYAQADRPNQLYMVGSMGCVSSLGLGCALVRPDLDTVIVDGDGAALMRMGNLPMVGTYGHERVYHVLLDNQVHESTGAQATLSGNVDFAAVAHACGYRRVYSGTDLALLDQLFSERDQGGPAFLHLRIERGVSEHLPRPALSPPEVKDRLRNWLAAPRST